MTRRQWRIFGMVQAGGILASLAACLAQDPLLFLVAGLALLPGSVTYWFTRHFFQPGYGAFMWPAFISVAVNLTVFALLSALVSLRKKRGEMA